MRTNVKQASMAIGLMVVSSMATYAHAQTDAAKKVLERAGSLSKVPTLDLCVEYSTLKSDKERTEHTKELDLRSQLSKKDHELIDKHQVENSMTMCGMYMSKGKPIAEKSRQLAPMTFKSVHIYPDMYYVTQSGVVVEHYPRKKGSVPPTLIPKIPKVQNSPTLKEAKPLKE